jgi:hypothetical protein
MANQEQIDLLKKGVEPWNQWRKEHPEVKPDLSFGVFIRTDLSRANFNSTILHRTTFTGEAPLGYDFLKGDFLMAQESLCNIDLSRADLRGTYFYQPILDETDFSYTHITQSIFRNIDLRQLKGLDKCEFSWRSSIDIDTIYLSQGKIPEVFLKGAGVPDSFIEYMRSLVGSPIDYYSCFISYSSIDEAFAKRIYADLQSNQVRCWFAPEDMKIGDKIRPRIDESIRIYDKLLLVLSEYSVASKWVEFEVEAAMDKEQEGKPPVLFPVRLDNTVMESTTAWASHIKRTRHIGDFTHWKNHDDYEKAFSRLLRDLKSEAISG